MTKHEYFCLLGQTMAGLHEAAMELELWDSNSKPPTIQEWNDEFMLELYEVTKDPRRA